MTKLTTEGMKAYQRERRQKAKAGLIETLQANPAVIKTTQDLETRLVRDRASKRGWHNPYSDGMDWPQIIQAMSQTQRDELLRKINRKGEFGTA